MKRHQYDSTLQGGTRGRSRCFGFTSGSCWKLHISWIHSLLQLTSSVLDSEPFQTMLRHETESSAATTWSTTTDWKQWRLICRLCIFLRPQETVTKGKYSVRSASRLSPRLLLRSLQSGPRVLSVQEIHCRGPGPSRQALYCKQRKLGCMMRFWGRGGGGSGVGHINRASPG